MVVTGQAGNSKADSEAESTSKASLTTTEHTENSGMGAATSVKTETGADASEETGEVCMAQTHKIATGSIGSALNGRRVSEATGLGTIWVGMLTTRSVGLTATLEISPKSLWIVFLGFGVSAIMVTGFCMAWRPRRLETLTW